jgi:hypothetical protein
LPNMSLSLHLHRTTVINFEINEPPSFIHTCSTN